MRKRFKYFSLIMLAVMLSSCSAERRALGQMRSLTTNIERHGEDYSIDEWKDAYLEFKEIDDKLDKTKLSPKQQQEYTQLQGRCIRTFAKSSVQNVKDGIATYLKEGIGIVKDIIDGILDIPE